LTIAVVVGAGFSGCGLFNTGDSETSTGRGAKVFDPYAGPDSGAIRLSLQVLNGCAVRANGEFAARGNANIPYPDDCGTYPYTNQPPGTVRSPITLLAGTTYFLNQLTFVEYAHNKHTDPSNLGAVVNWLRNETRFKSLDWTNVGVIRDQFITSELAINPYAYDRVVWFGNAAWQSHREQTFLVEVLDADGVPRQSITYERDDFLSENPISGHSQILWENVNLAKPRFPGDVNPGPAPAAPPGFPPTDPPSTSSVFRMDLKTSTRPSKSFRLDPGLVGDGAIRVTWSEMPDAPFYIPISIVRAEDVPATCYRGDDPSQRVPCSYGLKPEVIVDPPANGGPFFLPGERVSFRLAVKDGAGNYIHDPQKFPTWNQFARGESNGLLYTNLPHYLIMREKDTGTAWMLAGPHQEQRPYYELNTQPFFIAPTDQIITGVGNEGAVAIAGSGVFFAGVSGAIGGIRDTPIPTGFVVDLPADAKPGTYTIYWKVNRNFYGEDFTKMVPVDIQVGQRDKTSFPGRVGNCQICHRGVVSMDNVRHGLPVDYVEGCKSCHHINGFPGGGVTLQQRIHEVHMTSSKYPQPKNDCTFCHLTKESALRPSLVVCAACHPQPHGTAFFDQSLQSGFLPTENGRYGNCAEQCHQQTPPVGHILPAQ
jgi:hypothetical protein